MKTITGYKFITNDMKSKNGDITWKVGKWNKHVGSVNLCEKGFHACLSPLQAFNYTYGDVLCVVEARGEIVHANGDKFVEHLQPKKKEEQR